MREISRRDFIKIGGLGVVGGMFLSPNMTDTVRGLIARDAAPVVSHPVAVSVPGNRNWRFIVDITKCIGCGRCVKACKLENDVPLEPEYNRTWVERYVVTQSEQVLVDSPNAGIDGFTAPYMNVKYQNLDIRKSFFVPKLCNQCGKPPCVQVCPVAATYATEEGIVLVNRHACIGCRYCIQACPYGARFLDPRYKVVDKCTWCYHRIKKGLPPACVEVCPVGARIFGDIRDSASPVAKILSEKTVAVLKPGLGTEARVDYIGLERGVQ